MSRVLFVDDEQHVLDALAASLRRERRRFDMSFALGGEAAVDELMAAPVDILITDMRMPGMGGDRLLEIASDISPGTTRMVLSGEMGRAGTSRLFGLAHQVLAKPCDRDVLVVTIDRALALRDALGDARIRDVVGGASELPALPDVVAEVARLMDDPNASLADIGGVIERDPGLAGKVLQVANSAFFGLSQPMTSVGRAVAYLGATTVQGIVLAGEAFAAFPDAAAGGADLASAWRRALPTARLAREIAADHEGVPADDAFLAALVQDIGLGLLAHRMPGELRRAVTAAGQDEIRLPAAERAEIGVTHYEVGGYLLGSWGLPLPVVAAVTHHDRPGEADGDGVGVASVAHIADALCGGDLDLDLSHLDEDLVAALLERWQPRADQALEEVA